MTEISSVLFKALRMGGGGCAAEEAGDKQKIGRHEGLRTHHPCALSWGKSSYFDSVIIICLSVIEE